MNKVKSLLVTFVIMKFSSKLVEDATQKLSSLPGVGKRTALRLLLHMLKRNRKSIEDFGESFIKLARNINYCEKCFTISDLNICEICSDINRDKNTICVVEDIRVMMAIENTMQFKGIYHVLGGLISPMDGITPTDLRVEELIKKAENGEIKEIIFALSTTMDGDTTSFYLFRRMKEYNITISSIARGISIGDELEYTDEITLGTAISSRLPYENSLIK